jgi:hypothetical protein
MHPIKFIAVSLLQGAWLWSLLAVPCQATGDFQRETLRALPGVWVVVEHVGPELTQTGVTQADLQHDTEEKVQAAGIPLLSQEECWQTPGMPWLYLTVAVSVEGHDLRSDDSGLIPASATAAQPPMKTFGVT